MPLPYAKRNIIFLYLLSDRFILLADSIAGGAKKSIHPAFTVMGAADCAHESEGKEPDSSRR
jgi:hypothetical protein